jgi:8-oxo-dGTP pyrophosphatase MutT (NUDIX family)
MEKIITNKYNLKEEDMTEVVKRVKILMVNSKNEVLLGYSHHNYQFPGGHVEEGETLIETVNREITEETGIKIDIKDINPFACAIGYYKDWPAEGKNRKIEIYYYEIKTDVAPNLDNTEYTENEKDGGFELKYIPLNDVENELMDNAKKYGDERGITREMIELFKLYKNSIKND